MVPRIRCIGVAVTFSLLCLPASLVGLGADENVFPGKDWANASPESQGVDAVKLRAAVDYLDRELKEYGGAGTLFIVRNGYVIWAGPECDRQYQIFSATKSFTSTVLGLLIDDGKVALSTLGKDLDSALAAQYPTVTLRHFATMTSGYDSVGGSYEFDDQKRGDSWNPGPPAPPLFPPGSKFRYWDDAMSQFGSLLTKAAREPLDRVFKRRIADPIGMTQWRWTENDSPVGRVLTWTGGIHTSSRELARFGHLFLNKGNWNGRQLVSTSWVEQATSVQVPVSVPNDDLPRSRRRSLRVQLVGQRGETQRTAAVARRRPGRSTPTDCTTTSASWSPSGTWWSRGPTEEERTARRTARLTWMRSGAASSPDWPRRSRRSRLRSACTPTIRSRSNQNATRCSCHETQNHSSPPDRRSRWLRRRGVDFAGRQRASLCGQREAESRSRGLRQPWR